MTNIVFSGNCPQCHLDNNKIEMRHNDFGFWECPKCLLQVLIEQDHALILPQRGDGNFKMTIAKLKKEYVLEETNSDTYANGILILDEKHLKDYLKKNIQPIEEFTLTKLIDSFVNYKFNGFSKKEYQKQSSHFKIDFEDSGIEEKLIDRDTNNNQNPLYTHAGLYFFLKIILNKYYNIDNSWLPEMGMTKILHYLSLKYFPRHESVLINSNPIFIKQRLKELTIDLMEIIYYDKKPILSYNLLEMKEINKEITLGKICKWKH